LNSASVSVYVSQEGGNPVPGASVVFYRQNNDGSRIPLGIEPQETDVVGYVGIVAPIVNLYATADKDTLHALHQIKRELLLLRRMLWPQREVLNALIRDEHPLIAEDTKLYFRDCYDHTIQIMDLVETYRDMTASMLDVYAPAPKNTACPREICPQ